jgi:hypothetical protein
MKKVACALLFALTYWLLYLFYYKSHEHWFTTAKVLLPLALLIKIVMIWRGRQEGDTLRSLLARLIKEKLGYKFLAYLEFELSLFKGVILFLFSPIRTYRGIKLSYFAGAYLPGAMMVLIFVLLGEMLLVHMIISSKASAGIWIQIFVILSEIFVLEILLGNLYYVQFSKLEISNSRVDIQLGKMWSLQFDLDQVKEISVLEESSSGTFEKVPRISLMQKPTARLTFHSNIKATRFFKSKELRVIDLFLREAELALLLRSCVVSIAK